MSARVPVTLIGQRGDAVDSALEFLEGNQVAVRWIDLDRDPLVPMLADDDLAHASLPLAIFADGSRLEAPPAYIELTAGLDRETLERRAAGSTRAARSGSSGGASTTARPWARHRSTVIDRSWSWARPTPPAKPPSISQTTKPTSPCSCVGTPWSDDWPRGYSRAALDPYYDLVAHLLDIRPVTSSL